MSSDQQNDQNSNSRSNKSFPAIDYASYAKMSQQQAQIEAQLRQKQQQYYAVKVARKKEIIRLKKEQFGQSSSEQDQGSSSKYQVNSNSQPQYNQQRSIQKHFQDKVDQIQNDIKPTLKTSFIVNCKSGDKIKQNCQLIFNQFTYSLQSNQKSYDQILAMKIPVIYKLNEKNLIIDLSEKSQNLTLSVINQINQKKLSNHYQIISKIIQSKNNYENKKYQQESTVNIHQKWILNSDAYGYLYKKSQYLGKWQKRFMIINKQGLFSYKNVNDKPSMIITWDTVKQLSTKFEFYLGGIVITITYNTTQTSISVPILNEFQNKVNKNWFYSIYKRSLKFK